MPGQFQPSPSYQIALQPVPIRLLYAEDLMKPRAYRDPTTGAMGEPQYRVNNLLRKDHPQVGELWNGLQSLMAQAFPGRQVKLPFKDGDAVNQQRAAEGKKPFDCYAGHYVVESKSKEKTTQGMVREPPRLIVLQSGVMTDYVGPQRDLAAPFFYSGVEACVLLTFKTYSGFGGGINCYIERAMSMNTGDRISVGRSNEDVFGSPDRMTEYVGRYSTQPVIPPQPVYAPAPGQPVYAPPPPPAAPPGYMSPPAYTPQPQPTPVYVQPVAPPGYPPPVYVQPVAPPGYPPPGQTPVY